MADETKPSRSKEVLGSKKVEPTVRELRSMSLERTTNGHIKATHDYGDDKPEVHAVETGGFFDHLKSAFNLSNEKASLDAKKANIAEYEKAHGSLTKPAAPAAAAAPDSYDKIRANIRAKASQPAAPVSDLLSRADALTKGK